MAFEDLGFLIMMMFPVEYVLEQKLDGLRKLGESV
jgi:hypothetical protein